MFCLNLSATDPFFNLALEEYLFRSGTGDYLVLGINTPSVIIGKHQAAHMETDTRYIYRRNIPVIRRISGGGAVFHDPGNLNFSFILNSLQGKQVDFRKYLEPVICFLSGLGIDARFEGKNDLRVGGLKISGNAEHVWRNRVLHHGTILFDSDLDDLSSSLRKDNSYYHTSAVKSNPAKVCNLKALIPALLNAEELKQKMMDFFLQQDNDNHEIFVTDEYKYETGKLAESKYRTWEWNYAYGPAYKIIKSITFRHEQADLSLFVKDGIIRECKIVGQKHLSELAGKLTGVRHMPQNIAETAGSDLLLSDDELFDFF
jgi:lipoate---protein ligase